MNIDEMEAGRELDVLVAEAMGLDMVVRQTIGPHIIWTPDDKVYEVPRYSTDIAAILPVAEQVVGTGHIKIKLMPPDEWNELYLAQVALWLGYIDPVRTAAEAVTGGQAIALALARAVVKAKETTP